MYAQPIKVSKARSCTVTEKPRCFDIFRHVDCL